VIGRWGRAARWLPAGTGRVVDVGCAFGFGSSVLAGGRRGYGVVGVEPDAAYVAAARRRYPWLPVVRGLGEALPLGQDTVDAVVLLDVLEHVPAPESLLDEVRRVLRPGGALILSVPYSGPLAALDSLNLYRALRRRWATLPPLDASEESGGGVHRHYRLDDVRRLLGPYFVVNRIARTGLGLAELLHLALLILCRGVLRSEGAYDALRYLYYGAYLLEDLFPTGPAGYHLTLRGQLLD
jgi:SAM-dependent methyltransferase